MKPRIALCLYGQFRTGMYCLPWIVKQFEFANVTVFSHVKAYDTYTNVEDASTSKAKQQIAAMIYKAFMDAGQSVVQPIQVIERHEDQPFLNQGSWHYAPLFASLQASVFTALQHMHTYAETFDYLVAQRTDILLGPNENTLESCWPKWPQPRTVWSVCRHMPAIPGEAKQGGVHDVFLMGTPGAMHSLIAATYEAVNHTGDTKAWQRFQFTGPNVLLSEAAQQMNLQVNELPLSLAIVRPNADQLQPAASSFAYHQRFWTSNHRGMANTLARN